MKNYIPIAMEQRHGRCPVVYIYSKKELYALFEHTKLKITNYFTDGIIKDRFIRWGIILKWFVNQFRDAFEAYAYNALLKSDVADE